MQTTIISVGNSRGVRIPKVFLEESGIEKEVEMSVKKGEIKIVPIVKNVSATVGLSEEALAVDWDKKEEDEAWGDL